ncbi:MAG: cyclase family protein [Proteobacteria bacterium]|nr:cyclase family protein [Pseudomonadota bacterium]
MKYRTVLGVLASITSLSAFALETADYQLIDLSHSYGEDTLYWPTSPSAFEKEELAFGLTDGGWFYSAYSVCTPEHGGTHLDAPVHFAKGGDTTEKIPLENLVAPAVVIDVSEKAAADRNYRLTAEDLREFENRHGKIAPGTIVLLRTDWSQYWPDAMAYLGDDTPGDASNLQFPGYGEAAARILAEDRRVAMLGVDSASVDYGKSQDFIVHRIGSAQGVANLENLTNLDQLPATGATILALPMKIEGGSGGPVRVVALVPK